MNITVPFNGQKDLIPAIEKYPQVKEIYGKLPSDFFGGGKNAFQIPPISKNMLRQCVKESHNAGMQFNYLLNASCLGNREWTRSGQYQMRRFIDWLGKTNVDAVTVAVPYLVELIKKSYPTFKVYISDLAYVNNPVRAKYWEQMGADRITVFNVDTTRDFGVLKEMRKSVRCSLQLIVNANCLFSCPFFMSHANLSAHGSQKDHFLKGFVIDYCRIRCRYEQIKNPINFIRSTWIRPEDIHYYEDIGIDSFKIIDRGMTTGILEKIVKAYVNRQYKGNLLDLFPNPSQTVLFKKKNILRKARYFFRPTTVNVFRLRKFAHLAFSDGICIDNEKLEGFLPGLMDRQCRNISCAECGYCEAIAVRALSIDQDVLREMDEIYTVCLDDIVSGRLFRYF